MLGTHLKSYSESTSKKRKSSSEKSEIQDKKRTTEATDISKKKSVSLATLGRAYGNNVSKLNVQKASRRHQSAQELREPWHSSSKNESRVYGDYYSWQASISYLETRRADSIISKGMKLFINEYTRNLQKCQIFERGHNVHPFATARLELLKKGYIANSSISSVFYDIDSRETFASNGIRKKNPANVKSLTLSALKTIELIRKFKSGKSIKEDLLVADKKEIGSTMNESRSSLMQKQSVLTKKNKNLDESNVIVEETEQKLLNRDGKNSDISIVYMGQNNKKNLDEQRVLSQNYSTNMKDNFYGVSPVISLQSMASLNKDENVKSVKALHPNAGVKRLSISRR